MIALQYRSQSQKAKNAIEQIKENSRPSVLQKLHQRQEEIK